LRPFPAPANWRTAALGKLKSIFTILSIERQRARSSPVGSINEPFPRAE
jgi:hypothetical protein